MQCVRSFGETLLLGGVAVLTDNVRVSRPRGQGRSPVRPKSAKSYSKRPNCVVSRPRVWTPPPAAAPNRAGHLAYALDSGDVP